MPRLHTEIKISVSSKPIKYFEDNVIAQVRLLGYKAQIA